jgi:hypothetical protein
MLCLCVYVLLGRPVPRSHEGSHRGRHGSDAANQYQAPGQEEDEDDWDCAGNRSQERAEEAQAQRVKKTAVILVSLVVAHFFLVSNSWFG